MGIFLTLLSWGILIWIWSLQGKARARNAQEAQRVRTEYFRKFILEGFGKMLGFISKADGHVSKVEVDVASRCLRSLGLTEEEYQFCARAFNGARSSSSDAFRACASQFASVVTQEARTLVYEMLWVVAAADGVLDGAEDRLLRSAAEYLDIDVTFYHYFKRMYFGGGNGQVGGGKSLKSEVEKAYARLGCSPSDTDDAVRSAYRKLAMRYHPDRLRAEGMPEGMVSRANQAMAEINAAWDAVKKDRNL